jgi:hypothetical protein
MADVVEHQPSRQGAVSALIGVGVGHHLGAALDAELAVAADKVLQPDMAAGVRVQNPLPVEPFIWGASSIVAHRCVEERPVPHPGVVELAVAACTVGTVAIINCAGRRRVHDAFNPMGAAA